MVVQPVIRSVFAPVLQGVLGSRGGAAAPGLLDVYRRPDGTSLYRRPDGTSLYKKP